MGPVGVSATISTMEHGQLFDITNADQIKHSGSIAQNWLLNGILVCGVLRREIKLGSFFCLISAC